MLCSPPASGDTPPLLLSLELSPAALGSFKGSITPWRSTLGSTMQWGLHLTKADPGTTTAVQPHHSRGTSRAWCTGCFSYAGGGTFSSLE